MTSAPVMSATEVFSAPRIEPVKAGKGNENFAGSLEQAVEKSVKGKETSNEREALKSKKEEDSRKVAEEVMSTVVTPKETMAQEVEAENAVEEELAVELVTDSVSKLMEVMENQLGVSKEELVETMEELGLTPMDLFVPEQLTTLFMEITQIEDSISLVTDEGAYQSWQVISESAANLLEEMAVKLELPKDQVVETLEPMVVTDEALLQEVMAKTSEALETNVTENAELLDEVVDAQGEEKQSAQPNTSTVEFTTAQTGENQGVQKGDSKRESDFFEARQEEQGTEQTSQSVGQTNDQTPVFTLGGQGEVVTAETVVETETYTPMSHMPDTQEIANQILDHIRVQVREDVTQLQMQLHPESLGAVHVLLISKNGTLTAQFTAQNEAVKVAMETQMIQLKEQFEEQGIKVDAVEVAVANHQFERQNQGDSQREYQREDRPRVRTRRIHLDELNDDELDLLLSDEEKVQVDMMRKSGSTVDYTA